MDTRALKEALAEENPQALFADGFDEALVGIARQFNRALACYDRKKCIDVLIKRDNMTHEEAEEFFSYNVVGAWMGENTPVFLDTGEEGEFSV